MRLARPSRTCGLTEEFKIYSYQRTIPRELAVTASQSRFSQQRFRACGSQGGNFCHRDGPLKRNRLALGGIRPVRGLIRRSCLSAAKDHREPAAVRRILTV
jgi:hypothetical protein